MEERQSRIFLAFLLSMGIWFAINYFVFPPPDPKKAKQQNAPSKPKTEQITIDQTSAPKEKQPATAKEENKKTTQKKAEENTKVERFYLTTDSFLVDFSSLGGRIERFFVQNYMDLDGKEVNIIKNDSDQVDFHGKKYKAIEVTRSNGFDFNFAIDKEDIINHDVNNSIPFNTVNFTPNVDSEKLFVQMEGVSPDATFTLKKEFQFYPKENYFKFKAIIVNNGTQKLVLATPGTEKFLYFRPFGSLGPIDNEHVDDRHQMHFFRFYYLNDSFKDNVDGSSSEGFFSSFFGKDSNKDKRYETVFGGAEGLDFFGTGSRYFIAVADPLNHQPYGVLLDNQPKNTTGVVSIYNNITIEPEKSYEFDYAAYVGIREADGMSFRDSTLDPNKSANTPFKGLSNKLDKSFNQGLTTPFRNGIVWVLKKLHDYTIPNYGWCIIIFAILFKAIFYPLNQKQAESMKKMQELNPQIKEINERYAKDAQLKQQKIMELYKKHNANPMGGCLPMLIQIPIFIALYTAFSDTIELWKSPFLWIGDLSEPDTVWKTPAVLGMATGLSVNILPLIMVGTQVLQTRLTSFTGDPNQKTMMYIMPVIMLYFFWTMPSGVTLYWTMQNVLSILQQVWTNKFGQLFKNKKK
ncbi:MAG: membrane protein insertase YidC [Leptospiraceae bacterium]|nr:membrane protein insertase YidC [Leptospiraceae bacterium]MCP5497695.1 membrane protein insertase YidC [Leptospiraceae bacterium]